MKNTGIALVMAMLQWLAAGAWAEEPTTKPNAAWANVVGAEKEITIRGYIGETGGFVGSFTLAGVADSAKAFQVVMPTLRRVGDTEGTEIDPANVKIEGADLTVKKGPKQFRIGIQNPSVSIPRVGVYRGI